jgi:hypothetical protein
MIGDAERGEVGERLGDDDVCLGHRVASALKEVQRAVVSVAGVGRSLIAASGCGL